MKFKILTYDSVESTNLQARTIAAEGADDGTIIIANKQYGGRGRSTRRWFSPLGGLWFSMILRPKVVSEVVAQLTMLSGVAVASVLRKVCDDDRIMIKWPNDIMYSDKKICGILSESSLDEYGNVSYAIVGIGINVNLLPEDFDESVRIIATSLEIKTGRKFDCQDLLRHILNEFNMLYQDWQKNGFSRVLLMWKSMNCTLGKNVLVKDDDHVIFSGLAKNLDEQGGLQVCALSGEQRCYNFGEISIRMIE